MSTVLHSNIVAALTAYLPDHISLPYSIEVERNKLGKVSKGFAILVGDSKPSASQVAGRLTLATSIQVRLSDTWAVQKNTDALQLTASHSLADRLLGVYAHLAEIKLGSQGVRNVTLVEISEPTYVDGESTVYRTLTIEANLKV